MTNEHDGEALVTSLEEARAQIDRYTALEKVCKEFVNEMYYGDANTAGEIAERFRVRISDWMAEGR